MDIEVNNGVVNGLSTSKNGRAWLEGEFTLEELETICFEIRKQCIKENIQPIGYLEGIIIESLED